MTKNIINQNHIAATPLLLDITAYGVGGIFGTREADSTQIKTSGGPSSG